MSDSIERYGGRGQTMQNNSERVSAIVAAAASDVARTRTGEKVPLSDMNRVEEIAYNYLLECSQSGSLPTITGVSSRFGTSRIALYEYARAHPGGPFARWLESFSDLCGEVCASAAMEGAVAAIPAIFVLKSRYNWRDNQVIELKSAEEYGPLGKPKTAEEIAELYDALPVD